MSDLLLTQAFSARAFGVAASGSAAPTHVCEWRTLDEARAVVPAWSALASRAAEPNPFAEPGALLPLLGALGRAPRLLLAWAGVPGAGRLAGLLPLDTPRLGFGFAGGAAMMAATKYGTLGLPLIGRDDPVGVWSALLAGLEQAGRPVLVMPHARTAGPVFEALRAAAASRGGGLRALGQHGRAVLAADRDAEAYFREEILRKRRKEWKRLWRRFGEAGHLEAETVGGPAVVDAFEEFLALEAKGWKGRRGTALAAQALDVGFARAMIADFAARGACEIDRIRLDGRLVAAVVVLRSGRAAFTWKLAYDEAHAAFSPGLQVMLRATERFLAEPAITFADSLAAPDHPLIDHVWRERMPMAALVVRTGPRGRWRAGLAAAEIDVHAGLRRIAKRALSDLATRLKRKRTPR